MNTKKWLVVGLILLAVVTSMTSLAQQASDVQPNQSEGRIWGIGMQAGFPYGGLISLRVWPVQPIGIEAILFLSGGAYLMEGTATVRGLVRLSDADLTDFYVVAGATFPLEGSAPVVSLMGGFEFGFRLAPMLAWNLEFGASYALDGYVNMTVGTGLHYYFFRSANDEDGF